MSFIWSLIVGGIIGAIAGAFLGKDVPGGIIGNIVVSASSRIEQLTPINFEHFRSQTCSGDASYGSWLHSCERPPLDAEYGLG